MPPFLNGEIQILAPTTAKKGNLIKVAFFAPQINFRINLLDGYTLFLGFFIVTGERHMTSGFIFVSKVNFNKGWLVLSFSVIYVDIYMMIHCKVMLLLIGKQKLA